MACAVANPVKCRSCGGTKNAPKRVPCSACKRTGYVSRACIHCSGDGGEVCNDSYHKTAKNPGFLPKALFDRYLIRSTSGDVNVSQKNIQTLAGARRAVKTSAKRYPCYGFEIVSEKFGNVVESYKPANGAAAPKVDRDNSREHVQHLKEAAKDETSYVLYVDGREYATYDTYGEAEREGKKSKGVWKVKTMRVNPGKLKYWVMTRTGMGISPGVAKSTPEAAKEWGGDLDTRYAASGRGSHTAWEFGIRQGVKANGYGSQVSKRNPLAARIPALSEWDSFGNHAGNKRSYQFMVGKTAQYNIIPVEHNGRYAGRYDVQSFAIGGNGHHSIGTVTTPGQGVTLVRAHYAKHKNDELLIKYQSNPGSNAEDDAAALYKTFHGTEALNTTEYETEEYERTVFTELGALIQLKVETTSGKLAELNAADPESSSVEQIIKLASSPDGKQLYFIGGDQSIDVRSIGFGAADMRDKMVIGLVRELTYQTQKAFDNHETINYFHENGEDTKVKTIADEFRRKPTLLYCPQDNTMSLAGGLYVVKAAGIIN